MSKTINIQQTGVDNPMTVDNLRTTDAGDWVLEDAAQVDALTVRGNGTVTAESKNIYGFDEVVVNVTEGSSGSSLAGNAHTGEIIPVDPSIQEGEVARVMGGTKKLKVNLQGGGTALYVPKQGLELGTLYATKNGRYRAAAEGYYAYSEVTANVDTSGGGGGGGGGGGDTLAASIEVTTPPTFTGPYGDGAYIGFDGIVVTAYDDDGDSLGVVPFNELVFPVTVAVYDPDAERSTIDIDDTTGLHLEGIPLPFAYTEGGVYEWKPERENWRMTDRYEFPPGVKTAAFVGADASQRGVKVVGASMSPFTYVNTGENHVTNVEQASSVTVNGMTFYIGGTNSWAVNNERGFEILYGYFNQSSSVLLGTDTIDRHIAYVMLFGTSTGGGGVHIPVQWPRTGDGVVLETSFPITVIPAGGHGED